MGHFYFTFWIVFLLKSTIRRIPKPIHVLRAGNRATHMSRMYFDLAIVGCLLKLSLVLSMLAMSINAHALNRVAEQSIAFHAGEHPPIDQLRAFDTVVIKATTALSNRDLSIERTSWVAWLPVRFLSTPSVEGTPTGASSSSTEAYVRSVITPLWDRGFRGFFLDTRDSTGVDGTAARTLELLRAIRHRFPETKLLTPDDREVVRQARSELFAVVLSPEVGASLAVDQSERVKELRGDSGLLVVMTDSCVAADRQCMRDRARELLRQGVVPYVADPLVSTVGVSRIEVMPRRVLVVQNRRPDVSIDASKGVRYLSMPLSYLGYRVEFAEAGDALPAITADRYAGVFMWLDGPLNGNTAPLSRWVEETIRQLASVLPSVSVHLLCFCKVP